MKIKLLSTKKLDVAAKALAEQKGIVLSEEEMIRIEPIADEEVTKRISTLSTERIAIAITSGNAAEILAQQLSLIETKQPDGWKVYCLSGKTKETIASIFGENKIAAVADNATMLAQKIVNDALSKVVFFCGSRRRDDLPEILATGGISVDEIILYKTENSTKQIKGAYDAVAFFSPSAVESFFSINTLHDQTVCFAIGNTTSKAVSRFSTNTVIQASVPDQETMINEIAHYFKL